MLGSPATRKADLETLEQKRELDNERERLQAWENDLKRKEKEFEAPSKPTGTNTADRIERNERTKRQNDCKVKITPRHSHSTPNRTTDEVSEQQSATARN